MKTSRFAVALTAALALTLSACGGAAVSDDGEGASAAGGTTSDGELGDPTGTQIVIGTNNSGAGRDEWIREEARKAGFNVEVAGLGGGDLTARVVTEAANPTINVVWGPSEDQFGLMKDADALVAFTPDWIDMVDPAVFTDDGLSYPYEIAPKVWMVNPEFVDEADIPTTISDLYTNPNLCGKYAVPTTFGGTTNRAIVASILNDFHDDAASMGISDSGWDAMRSFYECGYQTPEGESDFENMKSGKVPISYSYASGVPASVASFDFTPEIVYFEEGQPTNTNHIGLVGNSNQDVLAESKRFINWIGGTDAIGAYAGAHGILPVNEDAISQAMPLIREINDAYEPLDVDWAWANGLLDDWAAFIQLEIL